MRQYRIAVGASRTARQWHNKTVTWSELAGRLLEDRCTGETVSEYHNASKEQQGAWKDVGGFVGGYLREGRRKSGYVDYRSLVTLDADRVSNVAEFMETLHIAFPGVAAVVYSTHSHTADKPRLRLVIPLDRDVDTAEYEPIARRVAADCGIEQFDNTTYQPERLMYWPSHSKDADVVAESIAGEPLQADAILGRYHDWRDCSEWPRADTEKTIVRKTIERAADPLQKEGVVGAFCKAHPISDVLATILPDVYEPTQAPDRYTYKAGHVSGGLVVYEDKWAYAHNETDPGSSRLLNAFDLVRVHKFGSLDEEAKEGTATNRLPSYSAMVKFCDEDRATRREIVSAVSGSFDRIAEDSEEWEDMLETKKGVILCTRANLMLIMQNNPELKGKIRLNEFTGREEAGLLPWRTEGGGWTDTDDAGLRSYLELTYNLQGTKAIDDARALVASADSYHPIKNYLTALSWDGVPRVDRLVIDYLGAEPSELNIALTRLMMRASVARIMEPGCKYDLCVILYGPQGSYKSTLLEVLFGDWFSSSLSSVDGKEAMEQLRGAWGLELAELATANRASVESTKAFISKTSDRYRAAYARHSEDRKRQCVFFGTTNDPYFLQDSTGNRRFPIIVVRPELRRVTRVREALEADRDQIWAEAVSEYYRHKGEPLMLDERLSAQTEVLQKDFLNTADDPDREGVVAYATTLIPANWDELSLDQRVRWYRGGQGSADSSCREAGTEARDKVCALGYLYEYVGVRANDAKLKLLRRKIHRIMREELSALGWDGQDAPIKFRPPFGVQRGYRKQVTNE